jgi:hypothetical protein
MPTKPPSKGNGKPGALSTTRQAQPPGALANSGAQVLHDYLNRTEPTVGVTVDQLRDFRDSSIDEFKQFAIGGFLASGAFWILIERVFTEPLWWQDRLFQFCILALIAGIVVGYFGFQQLARRKRGMDRIIRDAEKLQKEREAMP